MGRSTAWTSGEVLTSSDMNLMPRGKLGYAEVTAEQTSITTETDLTSLSVTCTPGTSRRIRVSSWVVASSDTGGDEIDLRIKEGGTTLAEGLITVDTVGRFATISVSCILSPTSASHTYKLSLARTSGSGTLTLRGHATRPCFILVEDIGA